MIQMVKALGKKNVTCPMDFVEALRDLQVACDVADIKMSDYGITKEELPTLVTNARDTMGGLFELDPAPLSNEDVLAILQASYK